MKQIKGSKQDSERVGCHGYEMLQPPLVKRKRPVSYCIRYLPNELLNYANAIDAFRKIRMYQNTCRARSWSGILIEDQGIGGSLDKVGWRTRFLASEPLHRALGSRRHAQRCRRDGANLAPRQP
ncbi:hypothetical protein L1887_63281 [Cichorium endivia]|nr:hypothetical protein L1887_63281 [Cichorium endivia]